MKHHRLRIFALLAFVPGSLWAQEYSFRYFGVSEGLNNLAVRGIYQDRVGFIWASTENGVFRYDGERFEEFGLAQGLPAATGVALGEAPDGSLLAGGDFGLYLLKGNRFEMIPGNFKDISWAQGIQADGKGHTFVGAASGLMELSSSPRPGEFTVKAIPQAPGTSSPAAYGVLVDGNTVWYGCGLELCRMASGVTAVLGRESGLPDRACLTIKKDHDGNLWVRLRNGGVFELPVGQTRFRRPDTPVAPEGLGGVDAVDADGRILLPSPKGLMIGDAGGWQTVGQPAGLRGTVYSAFEDRQHSLWVGLAGRGLAQWRGYREWETYSTASGLGSDIVYEMLPRADGSLWVGTEGGLFRGVRRGSSMEWSKETKLGDSPVHSLQTGTNGDVWIGTEIRGIARMNPLTRGLQWYGERQGLFGKAAYTLRFDREQRLWAATESGLFMAQAPYRRFSRVMEVPSARIWAIAEGKDGAIWAGGGGGLYEYAAGRWRNFKQADGLSNLEVLSLGAGPDGAVWVGYRFGGGIDRVHSTAAGISVERGVERRGTGGIVYFLAFDANGRLWAGTERGVDMWDGSRWSHYDVSDGLAWDDCNLNAFAAEADGTVWIGTSGGLSRFKPRPRTTPDTPADVVFTRLAMGNTDVSGMSHPSFEAPSNSLSARYSVLNAPRQNAVVFRYRLLGASSAWIETAQRELQFAELAPGDYKLEVEAQDNEGLWTSQPAVFAFSILTAWYASWWLICICVLTPMSAAAGVLRWRMVSAQRRERELVCLVEEKTVDLRLANEELQRLSYTDSLTGLANRRIFDQVIVKECSRVVRMETMVSLLLLDVDHFKGLNDSQGHQRGDECLVLVAASLARMARRPIDLAVRYGGEEFALILPGANSKDAVRIAEAVRLAIAGLQLPYPASPLKPYLTVSLGVATAARGGWTTPEELIAAADRALYAAKRGGRNRTVAAVHDDLPVEPARTPQLKTA